jgi:cell division protease FtsH
VQFLDMNTGKRREDLSAETLKAIDERVAEIVEEQRRRAEKIVKQHRKEIELLRDLLLERKTIDTKTLGEVIPDNKNAAKQVKNLPDGADPTAA